MMLGSCQTTAFVIIRPPSSPHHKLLISRNRVASHHQVHVEVRSITKRETVLLVLLPTSKLKCLDMHIVNELSRTLTDKALYLVYASCSV